MAEYDNTNRFTLFRNNRKRDGKKDADFNGTFTDQDGREYWMNAWSTQPKNGGEKFLSGTIRLKEAQNDAPPVREQKRVQLDDDVPFTPEFR